MEKEPVGIDKAGVPGVEAHRLAHVHLQLPAQESDILSKEVVYTQKICLK